MKHFAIILFFIGLFFSSEAQNSCTYSDQGTNNSYALNSGEVLCIESGVFTGTITSFDSDAEIRVSNGAIFQPSSMQNVNGLITNNGIVKLMTSNTIGSNFSVSNDSGAVFQWNVAQVFTDMISVTNHKDAEMVFYTPFDISQGATMLNEGILKVKNNLSVQDGSVLSNEGVIFLTGNLDVSGMLFNSGLMKVTGYTNISSTALFTNKCSYFGKNTFTNGSNLTENYGYMNIYGGEAGNCKFVNNAQFYNDANGIIQSYEFDNNHNIIGSGSFTAQSLSRNFGSFGADGGGINFYDITPSNNQIFDVQQVLPDNSVSKTTMSVYDTTYISANCNQIAFPAFYSPLPVVITEFETTVPDCIPNLYWKTSQEKNSNYFELERKSEKDIAFHRIASINAAGHSDLELQYTYIDESLPNGNYQYRLKIVDLDGQYAYSRVSNVQVFCGNTGLTNVYPNPASDILNIAFPANGDDTYSIGIYDITGRLVYKNQYEFTNGFNKIKIPVDNLQNGYYSLLITNNVHTESFKFLKN